MLNPVNNPELRGQRAGDVEVFGANNRFGLYPVHTRFDSVCWFVVDQEEVDDFGLPLVVVQQASRREALDTLARVRPGYLEAVAPAAVYAAPLQMPAWDLNAEA